MPATSCGRFPQARPIANLPDAIGLLSCSCLRHPGNARILRSCGSRTFEQRQPVVAFDQAIVIDASVPRRLLHRAEDGPRGSRGAAISSGRVHDHVIASKASARRVRFHESKLQGVVLNKSRQIPYTRADFDSRHAAPVAKRIHGDFHEAALRGCSRLIRRSNGIAADGERAGWEAQ